MDIRRGIKNAIFNSAVTVNFIRTHLESYKHFDEPSSLL
jgi:hypothetical protein